MSYNPVPVYTPPASTAQHNMTVTVPAKRSYVVSGPGQRIHGQAVMSPDHAGFQRVDPRLVYVPASGQTLPTPPSAESQDSKRRRIGNGVYVPAREVYPEATYSYAHSPNTNGTYVRQEVLQHPQMVAVGKPQMVSPPHDQYPRPPPLQPVRAPQPHQKTRSSVALPPIETMVAQTPTNATATQSQSSGVEAMIMSIPILNKIKVLTQISGPLPAPGLTSPRPEMRGAIIAVEGMDPASVKSMTASLRDLLEKEGKFAVKIFNGPDPYNTIRVAKVTSAAGKRPKTTDAYLNLMSEWHEISREMVQYITSRPGADSQVMEVEDEDADCRMSGAGERDQVVRSPEKSVRIDAPLQESEMEEEADAEAVSPKTVGNELPRGHKGRSLSTLGSWLRKDSESSFDTRPPLRTFAPPHKSERIPPPPPTPPPATSPSHTNSAPKALSRIPPPMPPPSLTTTTATTTTTTIPPPAPPPASSTHIMACPEASAIPIAIAPHFQLTTVDANSISLPIGDNFSPPAHWQWFATMWRGSVGPDITIVIRGVDEDPAEPGDGAAKATPPATLPGIPGANGSTVAAPRERIASVAAGSGNAGGTGVEIRLHDSRAVIVKTNIISNLGIHGGAGGSGDEGKLVVAPGKNLTPTQQAKEMENWEKAKRRVGFEVEEFLRR
jgi:hypothetical protein